MKVVFWVSPLHLIKAATIATALPVETEPTHGYQELREEHETLEDTILATPAVNPEHFDWHWNNVRRHPIVDWTPSTFIVAGYRYPPRGTRKPGIDFERHPAKATVDHIAAAFGPEYTAQLPPQAYDLLALLTHPQKALTTVAALLEEHDPQTVVTKLANGETPQETPTKEEALKILKRETGLKKFTTTPQEYANQITTDQTTELLNVTELNYVTDAPPKASPNLDGKDEAITTSPTTQPKGRVELDLTHVDWENYRWADDLTGVIEPK